MSSKRSPLKRSRIIVKVEKDCENNDDDTEFCPDGENASDVSDHEIIEFPKPKKKIKREPSGFTNYRQPRKFNERWLLVDEVKDWIYPLKMDTRYVWCKFCKKKIRAHLADMRTHNKTQKHQRNLASTIPEVPAEVPFEVDETPSPSKANNIVITFPSQKDNSQEVIVVPVGQQRASSPQPSKEMIIPASIGFIGAGNMAQALMNSFLAKGLVEPHLLLVSAPSNRNLDKLPPTMRTTNNNNRVARECDVIFICVKPQMLTEMIEGLDPLERDHNPLFISVVAGYDILTLEQLLGSLVDAPRVVRTMPNTPCMIGQGCCVYTMGSNTNESDSKVVNSMLHSVGYCAEVPECQINAACGVAGSGPAYVYAIIEALADGGVKMGLPRALSQTLAANTVKGAASMVIETGKHPGQLKDDVCSPRGTTIAALHSLEKNGIRNALISAVEVAAIRSEELGSGKD